MRAEVVVLLAAAGVLLVIGVFGYMITETEIVAGDPPDVHMIQPYLPAGMTSLALGLIVLVVAVVAAVAMRSR
ncbi:MAG: hypothetical protein LN415_04240 [Candidatus Thermoplasmatota archaeon]|nr:hypothetical protein [Candidatus Thermoplasmatota archaeon]